MSLRFAFYGRVSTEDAQDPEASRSWQKRRAIDLISPHGGVLAAVLSPQHWGASGAHLVWTSRLHHLHK